MLRFLRLRDAGQYQYRGNLRTPVNTHLSGYLLEGSYRQAKGLIMEGRGLES